LWLTWGICLAVTLCGVILLLFQVLLSSQIARHSEEAVNRTLEGMLAYSLVFVCQLPVCVLTSLGVLIGRRVHAARQRVHSIQLDIDPFDPLCFSGEALYRGGVEEGEGEEEEELPSSADSIRLWSSDLL